MVPTLGILEVRPPLSPDAAGSRLATIARRRLAGKTLLEWLVRRASDAHWLQQVVVLAGDDVESQSLLAGLPPDVRVVSSAAPDALGRLADAIRQLRAHSIVRLNIANPFVDPELLDQLITAASADECDYAGFAFADGRPAIQSKLGVFGEWCLGSAVLKAAELAHHKVVRCDPTRFLYNRPDLFRVTLLPVPEKLNRQDVRLAIHNEEDWEHVQDLLDILGPESLDWRVIFSLIDRTTPPGELAPRKRFTGAGVVGRLAAAWE